ncbi:TIGR02147 family protein [Bdellovibrio sp. 22V]|uniref:TIGR02147 family protein n=1 Tax=Bdellovibrio TaxID=958 RepID=UPI002542F266|nr:TIGR02147 family protein [Bdellovibrio sp. 22V]WII72671.1 TIGR02147 family protein [Bdellovibrio sp. 22V]
MNKTSEFLLNEFQRRRSQNPTLTNAQFAKILGIPSSRLSDYINGRRIMTTTIGRQIVKGLGMTENDFDHLKNLIEFDRKKIKTLMPESQLKEDEFAIICDWYHFAILALVPIKTFQPNPQWIAERLNIPLEVAHAAIDRLVRLGLLVLEDGKFIVTQKQLETTHNIPSESLRRSHKQSLVQVLDNMDRVPLDLRDVTSITFPMNRKKIPEAKRLIRNFRRKMATLMTQGPKTDVYNLNVQLFPVTKVSK